MTLLAAHLLCVGLVALDQLVRALRIRLLIGAIGHPLSLRDAVAINAIGDTASAVTPMRIGGEPARLAGLLHHGVPATASFVAQAFEVITQWPMVILSTVVLGIWFAPGWLEQTGPLFLQGLRRTWVVVAVLGAISVVVWLLVRRVVHLAPRMTRRPWRRVRVYGRRLPPGTLLASAVLGFINVACRTAILPLLMTTLPDPPPLGPAILGSFALLYSQLVLPTPSGAGVVDLGLLAGAAGSAGEDGVTLLFWWRFYTTIIGVLVGAWFALHDFGWRALRGAVRRERP